MNGKRGPVLALALILSQTLAAALAGSTTTDTSASASPRKSDTGQQAPLDQIIIEARREKLNDLRAELEKTEDAFYEAFNKINTEPEYATHCTRKSHMGTRMLDRVCTPMFVDTASEAEAEAILEGRPVIPARESIMDKWPDYKKKLLTLTQSDPQLRKIAHDYAVLSGHYEAVRKEKHKGKWFVLN